MTDFIEREIGTLAGRMHGPSCIAGETEEDRQVQAWLKHLDRLHCGHDNSLMPDWLPETFQWGPCAWPLQWRDIPRLAYIDCGALACIAHTVVSARGLVSTPCQLILRTSKARSDHWRLRWSSGLGNPNWIEGNFCYHEAIAVRRTGQNWLVWDPTDARLRFHPRQGSTAYDDVVAIRFMNPSSYEPVIWEGRHFPIGRWTDLSER